LHSANDTAELEDALDVPDPDAVVGSAAFPASFAL
jgi:hypothetical protein